MRAPQILGSTTNASCNIACVACQSSNRPRRQQMAVAPVKFPRDLPLLAKSVHHNPLSSSCPINSLYLSSKHSQRGSETRLNPMSNSTIRTHIPMRSNGILPGGRNLGRRASEDMYMSTGWRLHYCKNTPYYCPSLIPFRYHAHLVLLLTKFPANVSAQMLSHRRMTTIA